MNKIDIVRYIKKYRMMFYMASCGIFIISCANMASPGGGPYDLEPPVVVRSTPGFNATNVTSNKIEIVFDELIQINSPTEKVIITPPQQRQPVIRSMSNRAIIELRDTLLPNTTYTIDFTDAIVDNNEGIPLENFSLSFSTGDVVDTLAVSGKVLSAENLEPMKGMYVGLHSNLEDSAFTNTMFDKISKTNDRGQFTIRGVAPGTYRVYALNDLNRDYKYDNPLEEIAFLDTIVAPSITGAVRYDTIFNLLDNSIDTILTVNYTRFLPDNILLRTFLSPFKRQYLQSYSRPEDNILNVYFGAPTELPELTPLNFVENGEWAVLEKSRYNDTLQYWIIDPNVIELDTISVQIAYYMTDSLNQTVQTMDTLNFANRSRRQRDNKKNDDKQEEEENKFLTIRANVSNVWDVYKPINIEFEHPVREFTKEDFYLSRKVDTLYTVIEDSNIILEYDTLNPRKYTINYRWEPGDEYKLTIDSATVYTYSGLWNDKLERTFKIKELSEYGRLIIDLYGLENNTPAFVELLDGSDKPKYKANVRNSEAAFLYLDPGTYYARIILDTNNNGQWDTGDFDENRQPEMVYYRNTPFVIKAYFDHEESWNITSLPLDKQKPLEITKNKPEEKESRLEQLQRQEAERNKRDRENSTTNNMNNTGVNNNNYQYQNPMNY